jgi:tetratricopeptide (TPR) repeat protein
MLDLSGVTLCCIDTANHALALRALRRSAEETRFARTLFITDRPTDEPGIDVAIIDRLVSRDAYSRFVLKSLVDHVHTPHLLLVQWDGYAVNPLAWRSEFLEYDYIGAQWFWHDDGMRVGNGGFSLRSRKLLRALQDERIDLVDAEDVTICRAFRPLLERDHAIRFAPEAVADAFAFEAAYPIGRPYGFHGLFNFCRTVAPEELTTLVANFTPEIARSLQLAQLARNCLALGQWQAASAIFQRILDEDPGNTQAVAGLGAASAGATSVPAAGRNDPCPCGSGKRYKHCHGAIGADVGTAVAPQRLAQEALERAIDLHRKGDTSAAEQAYRKALAEDPRNVMARHYLGVVHYQRNDLGAALPLLEASVKASAHEPEFHNNLGLAYAAADREEEALIAYRAALLLKPDHAAACNNLGLTMQAGNDVSGAIYAFQRAVHLKPDFAHAHWNLSLALLLDGQFAAGWNEYEWRLRLPELGRDRHSFSGQLWDGRPPAGKTILLYAEQGLGDAIQFARYASRLARDGARVLVRCAEPLRPLMARVEGVAEVVLESDPLPRYDAYLPLLSLPRVFTTDLASIPADVPYILPAEAVCEDVRQSLPPHRHGLRVGIAWAGSKSHSNDRNRSCTLATLAPLFDVPNVELFSLQHGDAGRQMGDGSNVSRLVALAPDVTLERTAALIAELDLVISVDTSIAHLAGAMAKPCWVMLPFAPDWRWMLTRTDSPWYPTLRLFRQRRPRAWPPVVNRIAVDLAALAAAK